MRHPLGSVGPSRNYLAFIVNSHFLQKIHSQRSVVEELQRESRKVCKSATDWNFFNKCWKNIRLTYVFCNSPTNPLAHQVWSSISGHPAHISWHWWNNINRTLILSKSLVKDFIMFGTYNSGLTNLLLIGMIPI